MEPILIKKKIEKLGRLFTQGMRLKDFLLTWDRSDEEIAAVFTTV